MPLVEVKELRSLKKKTVNIDTKMTGHAIIPVRYISITPLYKMFLIHPPKGDPIIHRDRI